MLKIHSVKIKAIGLIVALSLGLVMENPSNTYAVTKTSVATETFAGFEEAYYWIPLGSEYELKENFPKDVVFKFGDSTTASIDNNGVIKGLQEGRTNLYATCNNKTYRCMIAVVNPRLTVPYSQKEVTHDDSIIVDFKYRKEQEEITVEVEDESILTANVSKYEGSKGIITIALKKKGTTSITIGRTKSMETYKVDITVSEPKELSAVEIYEQCSRAMVEITTVDAKGNKSLGSGFFFDKDKILTNYHVIKDSVDLTVIDYDGEAFEILTLYDYDEDTDLAILGVDNNHAFLEPSYAAEKIGDRIYTIGSPLGFTGTFSTGIISKTLRKVEDEIYYTQFTAPISKGNSGGPLINRYGEVIGVNTWTRADGQNLNFAVPIMYVMDLYLLSPTEIGAFYEQNK